jgi:peroxiredoxin
MNRKMLKTYGILKGYNVQDETYEWALRANIVIDKQGVIQLIDEGDSAVDPNTALTMCTTLHKKDAAAK